MSRQLRDSEFLRRIEQNFAHGKLHPVMEKLVDESEYADAVSEWLTDLRLLEGVPFNHLVADADLLPQDSIRFFHLDPNWLNALLDGAMSVGGQSKVHLAVQQALQPAFLQEARARAPMVRRRLLGYSDQDAPAASDQVTGFLLRSQVVYTYPGLEVRAFGGKEIVGSGPDYNGTHPLSLLRMDRLAPDVMLCLFNGMPALVQINEPLEGLAFGAQDTDTGSGVGQFQLRGLGELWSDNKVYWEPGQQITDGGANVYADVPWRDQAARTVDLGKLYGSLPSTLSQHQAHQLTQPFGPADFALQLLSLPETIKFFGPGTLSQPRTGKK